VARTRVLAQRRRVMVGRYEIFPRILVRSYHPRMQCLCHTIAFGVASALVGSCQKCYETLNITLFLSTIFRRTISSYRLDITTR
jgi:hypothetical protein